MQRPDLEDNLRQSYRCAVDGTQREAMLCAGGEWTPVDVVDQSAGGFGVVVDRELGVAVGDVIQLKTASGCVEAEVVRVAPYETSDDDAPVVRLGLKRIREVFVEPEVTTPWFRRFRGAWRRTPYGTGTSVGGTGLLLVLLIGALPTVAVLLLRANFFTEAQPEAKPADGHVQVKHWTIPANETEARRPVKRSSEKPTKPTTARSHDTVNTGPPVDSATDEGWRRLLEHAGGQADAGSRGDALLAVMANLGDRVNLSESQQSRIARILQQADETLARSMPAPAGARDEQTEQRRLSILQDAYNQLIEQLTDTQRTEWTRLLNESVGAPESR